jgi:transcriptional regulator with XRE-family HTH domain
MAAAKVPGPVPEAARAELGARLQSWRAAAGLTQMRLGEAIDCSSQTVSLAETGRTIPGRWFWERADASVGAGGALLAAYDTYVAGLAPEGPRLGGHPLAELSPYRSLWHFLGAELRVWRLRRGLAQDALGLRVHASGDLVRKVEVGERTPTAELITACDAVLDTGGVLSRLRALAVADPFSVRQAALVDRGSPVNGGVPAGGGAPVTVVFNVVTSGEVDAGDWTARAVPGSDGAVVRLADRRRPRGGRAG